jgi:1-acyl-sn-glycerol-3-phosphate acyltransferase
MVQRFARWLGGIALHWFYSDVHVVGADRIPARGPVLVAMNHQNALVDAILALWIVPRDLRITAKATLGSTLPGALMMKAIGIIPLSRASDVTSSPDPIRNRHSFEAIIDALRDGGAVLVFPEGKSHNDPEIAPLKTGLARAALRAREACVHGIQIIPIGITFADKAEPGTAVLAEIGDPIMVDDWIGTDAHKLTDVVADRLSGISLLETITPTGIRSPRPNPLIRILAWWGRIMHETPLRIARRQAMIHSTDAGEPAMYTMTYGLAAVIVSYLIEVPVVWILCGWPAALVFLASLVTGAYWAAYSEHSPSISRT